MFLAEDRILCAELVSKKKCRYVLSHVRNARGAWHAARAHHQTLSRARSGTSPVSRKPGLMSTPAAAYTDVPTNVVDLMRQRRRWTNGALFATLVRCGGRRTRARHRLLTLCAPVCTAVPAPPSPRLEPWDHPEADVPLAVHLHLAQCADFLLHRRRVLHRSARPHEQVRACIDRDRSSG